MSVTALPTLGVESDAQPRAFLTRPGRIERIAAVLGIFVFSFSLPQEWFLRTNSETASQVQSGGAVTQLVFLSLLFVAIVGINGNIVLAVQTAWREPLLPTLLMLALLSSFWSTGFASTFQDAAIICITFVIAISFAIRFTLREILLYAGIALAIGVLINFAFILIFEEFGVDTINVGTDGGARWSGVFSTKNELGRIAVLSVVIFSFLARLRRSFFFWPLFVVLAAIQVIGSDSATSLAALGAMAGLMAIFPGFRGKRTIYGATALGLATVFSVIVLLAATDLATLTGLVGKDETFTGRLPLWVNSFRYGINERPWLGYGWQGFWRDGLAPFDIRLRTSFNVPHAHNAFIDVWLYVGPIGFVLLAGTYIRGLVWGARNIRYESTIVAMFPLIMISNALIFSLSEAGVVRRDISFILFVIAIVTAAKHKGDRRSFKDHPSATNPSHATVGVE